MMPEILTPVQSRLATNIPPLSLQAWERMLAKPPKATSVPAMPELIQQWATLRLAQLPGWEVLADWAEDSWVFCYEQCQETIAKQQRKSGGIQNGVFYTLPTVARYLTQQTLGCYLKQTAEKIHQALKQKETSIAQAHWAAVQNIRVIDPACGTGVFLVEALKLFHEFYQQLALKIPAFKLPNAAHYALAHQLAGIDLDPLSVMIAEFRLVQWAAHLDGPVAAWDPAKLSFVVGDTLQDSWETALSVSSSSTKEQWQFILGNPPYVSEVRGQSSRFKPLQDVSSNYYQAKMDLCDGFLAWAIDHLKPGGQLAYVLPAYWTQRSSTAPLRVRLWDEGQLLETWTFEGAPLFKNAPGHHSALMIWQKQGLPANSHLADPSHNSSQLREINNKFAEHQSKKDGGDSQPIPQDQLAEAQVLIQQDLEQPRRLQVGQGRSEADLQASQLSSQWIGLDGRSGKLVLGNAVELGLLAKLSAMPSLLSAQDIQQGLVIPQGRLKPADKARLPQTVQETLSAEPGVFVLKPEEQAALAFNDAEKALLRPYYRPAGFEAFQGFLQPNTFEQIIYTDLENRRALESNPERYACLRAHLQRFSSVNTSAFAPYGLHRARQAVWFEDGCKILAPRQVFTPAFAVVPFPAYVNEGFLIVRSSQDPHWLCALLNSDLAWFWFYHQKRKGVRLQIDKEVLCQFPKPSVSQEIHGESAWLAKQLSLPNQPLSTRKEWLAQLNSLMNQAYQLTAAECAEIEVLRSRLWPSAGGKSS